MGRSVPTTSPDVEKWLIQTFATTVAPAIVRNQRPPAKLPSGAANPDFAKSLALIRADLQGHATPVSRYCRVAIQGRAALRADGSADLEASFALAAKLADAIVAAPRAGGLVDAEHQSGPYRVLDPNLGIEYSVVNLLLQIAV